MPQINHDPRAMKTITPQLTCRGATDAIEFYKKAFGAVEEARLPGPDGKLMHAMLRIGDSRIMLNDESPDMRTVGPKTLNGSPVTIHLYVDDAAAAVERAKKAGAKVTMPVEDMFWGDKYGQIEDPFGHHWSVGQHVRDVSDEEIRQAVQKMTKQ